MPYHIPMEDVVANSATSKDDLELWHRRLGHTPYKLLGDIDPVSLGRKLIVPAELAKAHKEQCTICPKSRMKRKPYGNTTRDTPEPKEFGDEIHMDLAGPLPKSFRAGSRYVALFYDVATEYMVVYPLRSKDENTTATKRFCADLRAYGGDTIKHFHSDNGGEYTGREYCTMITDMGASKSTTVPYNPNLNGRAERCFWSANA